uniref:Uncharacterized protein n=1 Tax=Arion vulgaris TaxID=1028688 RepID=A0A0B6Z4J7_9EUPU
MARGALSRLWPRPRTMSSRRRSLLRRYIREIYNRPTFALQRSSTFSLCDMVVTDLHHVSSRTRLYSDDPPSYDTVTSEDFIYQDTYVHAYTNPANEVEDDIVTRDPPPRIVISLVPQPDPPHEDQQPTTEAHCPPPSYDEYILSEHMKTTTL